MNNASFQATQTSVCGPRIVENIGRLISGEVPPPIQVAEGMIYEGHHRYIAGMFLGQLPSTVELNDYPSKYATQWHNIEVDFKWWKF